MVNANIVISLSALAVSLFCLVFFVLAAENGFDENSVFHGSLSSDDAGGISAKFVQDVTKSIYTTLGDGSSSFITDIDGEIVKFDFDSAGALTSCGSNNNVDIEQVGFFFDQVHGSWVAGENNLTDEDGVAVSIMYEITEGAAPADFLPATPTSEECKAIFEVNAGQVRRELKAESDATGKPVGQLLMEKYYLDNDKPEEFDVEGRKLTAADDLAFKSYSECTFEEPGIFGSACVLIEDCSIAFRGSDDLDDWFANGKGVFSKTKVNGKVLHGGFVGEFMRLEKWLTSYLKKCDNPTFIGHSLGGAMATVAWNHYRKGTVITFGAPQLYDNDPDCFTSGTRMFHEEDPVAGNMFGLLGSYWHGQRGTEIYRECSEKNWHGGCERYSAYTKRDVGCDKNSGTWSTEIDAHSLTNYQNYF